MIFQMEIWKTYQAWNISTVIVSTFFSLMVVAVLRLAYNRHKKQKIFSSYGIPGPKPNFFTGNFLDMKKESTSANTISKWIEKYGDVFGYFIGETPNLVVKNPEIIKAVLIKEIHIFTNRPKQAADPYPLKHSLVWLEGDEWKETRKAITPAFTTGKLKNMETIFQDKINILVKMIKGHSECNEMIDLKKLFLSYELDVISECALAMKTNCMTDKNDVLGKSVKEFMNNAETGFVHIALLFPFISEVYNAFSEFLVVGKMNRIISNNISKVIENRRQNTLVHRRDFLQLMINCINDHRSNETKESFVNNDKIIGNAEIFITAGLETTASTLTCALHSLAKHPEYQEKLYEEIDGLVGDKNFPNYSDVVKMEYLDQVFNETLRLFPPIDLFLSRHCKEDITIDGVTIPKGVNVQIPLWNIHHDPTLWPDPFQFNPERFSPENKNEIHSMSFIPFGEGPRVCIGKRFAQMQAKLTLARLIYSFRFERCEKTEDTLELTSLMFATSTPKNSVFLRAVSR